MYRSRSRCIYLQANATKAAMEVALARAAMQKDGYLQYRDMVLFDRQLDIANLAPAFKAACNFEALVAKAEGMHAQQFQGCKLKQVYWFLFSVMARLQTAYVTEQ